MNCNQAHRRLGCSETHIVQVKQHHHQGDKQDILCIEQCYGRMSFVRSRPNSLLFYVSNFLNVFHVLGWSFVFCGKTGKWSSF